MSNKTVNLPEEILSEVDSLLKESGISAQDFVNSVASFYNVKNSIERDVIDSSAYYDSFIA